MDLLSKNHISGILKHDWKFLLKLFLSGLFTALGVWELGLNLELAFVALIFVPLGGLFFTYLRHEADTNIIRMISIIVIAVALGFLFKSVFLAIAFLLMLEGATHKDSLARFEDFKWMRIVKTESSKDELHQLVSDHNLFRTLPREACDDLANHCTITELEPGATLIKQGEFNYYLFLIAKGSVDVIADGEMVASLKQGDVVGEISASGLALPVADVVAQTEVMAFAFPIDAINEAAEEHPKFAEKMREIGMRRIT